MKQKTKQNKKSKLLTSGLIAFVLLLSSLSLMIMISNPVEAEADGCDPICECDPYQPRAKFPGGSTTAEGGDNSGISVTWTTENSENIAVSWTADPPVIQVVTKEDGYTYYHPGGESGYIEWNTTNPDDPTGPHSISHITFCGTTTLDCEHNCLIPTNLSDSTVENIDDSTQLTGYLSDYGITGIDVINDQTQYQLWEFAENVQTVDLQFEYIGREAGHQNVFGYYFDSDETTFEGVFESPDDNGNDHSLYDLDIASPGDIYTIEDISLSSLGTIGFGIDTENGTIYKHFTENNLNDPIQDRVLVFEICNDSTNSYEYLLCFEDLKDNNDYDDIIVIMRVLGCDDCESNPPDINKIVIGENFTGSEVEQPNIDYFSKSGLQIDAEITDESNYTVYYNVSDVDEPNPTGTFWFSSEFPCHDPIELTDLCLNYVKIWAIDDCGNIAWDNETFCIDEMVPTQTVDFGEPKVTTADGKIVGIGPDTKVWLNSSDLMNCCGVGTERLEYQLWINDSMTQDWVTVWDNQTGDINPEQGVVSVLIDDWTTCKHEIHYRCYDLLGNIDGIHTSDFYVDAECPSSETEISSPNFFERFDNVDYYWINCSQVKYINATDEGCTYGDGWNAGIDRIEWEIYTDTDVDGIYDEPGEPFYSGVVYDNETGDTNPTVGEINIVLQFNEDCSHMILHRTYDKLGNNETWQKQFLKLDCTPPDINKSVNGPSCGPDEDGYGNDVWCVTMDTFINFTVEDLGCFWQADEPGHPGIGLDTVYYRIWNMTHGWSSPVNVEIDCENNNAIESYQFTEECKHYLEIVAIDKLGNTMIDNETFYVDEQEPKLSIIPGTPQCEKDDGSYCVNFSTEILLEAWEQGCCNELINVSMKVINDDTGVETDWTMLQFNSTYGMMDYHFSEECNHTIILYAEDCLGNSNMTSMSFHVDESEPGVDISVGSPQCLEYDGSYCVNFSTMIQLSAWEQGCCNNLSYVAYNVTNDDTGTYSGWTELSISNEEAYFEYYFDEECNHTIELMAVDCLGNSNYTATQFHVDEQEPSVEIIVGTPQCERDDGSYCVNFSTMIELIVNEQGCCNNLSYVAYNVTNDDTGTYSGWQIMEYYQGYSYLKYQFSEECNHTIELMAVDCLGNSNYTATQFRVDEQEPSVEVDVDDTKCIPDDGYDYCIRTDTPINISIAEQGCCDELLNASYRIINESGPGPWISILDDSMPVTVFIDEECNHTLEVQAWDCLMNTNMTALTFHVDDSPPGVDISVGGPQCEINTAYYCVNLSTPINLSVWENGCCNTLVNASYRIKNSSSPVPGPWQEMNIIDDSAFETYYFTEECTHYLTLYAEDCLGNSNQISYKFQVDESEPSIDVEVGQEQCIPDDGYDYCIRTDTPINISIAEQGCCNDLINASYRIINESGPGPWISILDDSMPVTVFIDEECNHTLEVQAWDCLMNTNMTALTFHVDDSPPMITKDVGEPKIEIPTRDDELQESKDYWVNCTTPITIDADDIGCCDSLSNVSYRLNGGAWVSILGILPTTINLNENCDQTLDIVAKDCLGNTMYHNETFNVDCTPPESWKTFTGPTYEEDLNDNGIIDNDEERYYWLQDSSEGIPGTKIILTASENTSDNMNCDSGIDYLHVELWWDSDLNGTIDADEMVWSREITDDDENDSEQVCPGIIEYNFTIAEDCLHEIRWYSVDKLGNKELIHTQQHRVDSQPPETVKTIDEPKWWDEDKGLWWVNSTTNFNLKSTDLQDPCAVGVHNLTVTLEYNCDNESEYSVYSHNVIFDNMTGDLNLTEGVIEYNFTLPMEGWWRITWKAIDLLGNEEILNVQYHIVDETPPHVIILKPTNGWYAPGSVIPSVVLSEDLPSPHSPCGMDSEAVGIEQGQQGNAWLIDIFPEFQIIELDTTNFLYDQASHEYIGNIRIPDDIDIDGAALFVAGSEDRLGNNWTSIHELIHAYIIDATTSCNSEDCVMQFLADELSDFIEDQNIVFVGIDSTPPEVEFDEEEAPIPDVLFPGFQLISADIFDNLSGVEPGTPCYVTLNGASLGTLWYDPYIQGCSGSVIIPQLPFNLDDAELTISVYDHAGNKGTDTVIVDYRNQASDVIPTVVILDPEDNTNHSNILTVEIQAHDSGYDGTPTKNLTVFVRLMHEEEPSMKYYATYNATTDTFFVEIDISKYTHGSILDIQAFATDLDGYTGDSDFRLYRVHSNIIQDQWFGPGWNLINIVDLCGEILPVEEVLASIDGHYDWVFEVGSWDSYYTGRVNQDLNEMEEGKWYWINITTWQGVRFYLEECIIPSENMPPVALNDSYTSIVREFNEDIDVNTEDDGVLSNDSDPDGDPITAHLVDDAMYGLVTLNENGSFTYIPDNLEMGVYVDSFTYVARDDKGAESDVTTVFITYYATNLES